MIKNNLILCLLSSFLIFMSSCAKKDVQPTGFEDKENSDIKNDGNDKNVGKSGKKKKVVQETAPIKIPTGPKKDNEQPIPKHEPKPESKKPIVTTSTTVEPINIPKSEPKQPIIIPSTEPKKEEIKPNLSIEDIVKKMQEKNLWFHEEKLKNFNASLLGLTKDTDELVKTKFEKEDSLGKKNISFFEAMLNGIIKVKEADVDSLSKSLKHVLSLVKYKIWYQKDVRDLPPETVMVLLKNPRIYESALEILNEYGFDAGSLVLFARQENFKDIFRDFYLYLKYFKTNNLKLLNVYNSLILKECMFRYFAYTQFICTFLKKEGDIKTRCEDFPTIFKNLYSALDDEEEKTNFRSQFISYLLKDISINHDGYSKIYEVFYINNELPIQYFQNLSKDIIQQSNAWGFDIVNDKFKLPDDSKTNILYFMLKSVENDSFEKEFYSAFFNGSKTDYNLKTAFEKESKLDKWKEYVSDDTLKLYNERMSILWPPKITTQPVQSEENKARGEQLREGLRKLFESNKITLKYATTTQLKESARKQFELLLENFEKPLEVLKNTHNYQEQEEDRQLRREIMDIIDDLEK